MRRAEDGDAVRVHYVGTLASGAEFDSSRSREPLDVSIGDGGLIPAFEKALVGMSLGEVKQITVSPEDAYGQRRDAMVHTVAREQLPQGLELRLGMMLEAQDQAGDPIQFRVTGFDDDRAVLDANHPLAGETLTFQIELMEFVSDAD